MSHPEPTARQDPDRQPGRPSTCGNTPPGGSSREPAATPPPDPQPGQEGSRCDMLGARHSTATHTRPYAGCWSSRSHSRSEQVPLRSRSPGRRPDRRRERVPVGSGRACGKAGPRPTGAGRGFTGGERQRAVSAWLGPVAGGCRRAGRRASSSGGGIRGRDGWIAVAGRARRRLPRATLTAGGFGPEWSPPTRPDACLARPPDSRRSRSLSAVPS